MTSAGDHGINVEMFSCAGGMAEGFRRAGITFDMAIDKAKDHCDSYERNLGHRPIQMDASDFLRMLRNGLRVKVNLFVADPPCTPWSRAGKRKGLTDERDMLRETAEIIGLLRPRAYLIGNVPGLEDSNNQRTVQDVIGGLAQHGYCVADFTTLDAADFGVPQHRVRPFWFGHLHGPCVRWIPPTHGDPSSMRMQDTLPGVEALLPWVTCGQALGHLTPKELGRMVKLRRRGQNSKQHGSLFQKPARVVGTSNLSDGNVMLPAAGNGHQPHDVGSPAHTITSSSGRGAPGVLRLEGTNDGNMDEPSRTILAAPRGSQKVALSHPKNHPPSYIDEPAMTIRAGDGGGATRALQLAPREVGDTVDRRHRADQPARTMTARDRGAPLVLNDKHMAASLDAPAPTMGAKYRGQSAHLLSLEGRGALPQSQRLVDSDRPADTIQAREDRMGSGMTMTWPWPRPSTTITTRNQQPPPGRNGRAKGAKGSRAHERGVLLSEKAAAILQGFPESWVFSGQTKKVRWSQIGQAMPPPLAHAVAISIQHQMAATVDDGPGERYVPWSPLPPRGEVTPAEQVPLFRAAGGAV